MRTLSPLRGLAAALLLVFAMIATTHTADAAPRQAAPRADFFVAPAGDDAWSGTLAAPNAARTDGPFATVGRAQKSVRAKRRAAAGAPITVLLRGGFYPLAETLVFTPEDGGTAGAPVTYAAFPGETPVLSGGVRLGDFKTAGSRVESRDRQATDLQGNTSASRSWRIVGGTRWEVSLPEVAAGKWQFGQLYVNGERRYRPRLPKSGYYFVAAEVPSTPEQAGKGFDRFRYRAGDLRADWKNRDDVEVLPFHVWTMSRFRIRDVDEAGRVVTFTRGTRNAAAFSKMDAGKRYLVENVAEALSDPGEWYLDRKTGVLTYLSRPGENPASAEVVAPRLERLLEVRGDPAKREWVRGLVFRDLTFAHAAWQIPPDGNSYPQAEVGIGGALVVRGGRDVAFERCVVRNVGGYGVEIADGSQRVRLDGCALFDLGAGGVKVGETRHVPDPELATDHNAVSDCWIAHGGRLHPSAVGVWIGHSAHNTIEHNEIFDFYYTGISPGWSWGYGPSGAHHNRIANNHIHRIGQGVLSDMGGIYTLGVSPGTVLEGNLIHDIRSYDYGGWGIYFDEGSTGIVARGNVAYDTKSAPFHQHYGTDNLVENNVFAFGREAQLMRTRADNNNKPEPDKRSALSFTLRRNIVLWKEGPLLGSNWTGSNFALERNVYWHAGGQPVRFVGGADLAAWQARGFDAGSVVADPQFVAPEKGDFRLKPGSPALALGFQPLDLRGAGPRPGKLPRFERPAGVPPAFPPPPPPRPVAEDFEEQVAGEKPGGEGLVVQEDADVPAARVRVTGETAASGRRSVKVTDAPGQKAAYNPHLYYRTKLGAGTVVGKFALRWEAGTALTHEWRDAANPYVAGPSLGVARDGTLRANGQETLRLPPGAWVQIEITCPLGDAAKGAYDLTVRVPGSPPRSFHGIKCSAGFRELRWFGFIADGNEPGTFYLDDLRIAPAP